MATFRPDMTRLIWIDLEMTGLDVKKEAIIECAAVITDMSFNHLESYHTVVKQPQHYLDNMDDWNREHHGDSGLTKKVEHGKEPKKVEEDLLFLINKHFPAGERPVLAGNSIAQDRLFIDKEWPKLSAKLHYRMLDVTSFKIIFNNLYGIKYMKKNAHRATDDVLESIEELKMYLSHIHL